MKLQVIISLVKDSLFTQLHRQHSHVTRRQTMVHIRMPLTQALLLAAAMLCAHVTDLIPPNLSSR